jgi:hypothetical protein
MDWIRDSGSEIWDLEKTVSRILDPEPPVKKTLYPGSWVSISNAALSMECCEIRHTVPVLTGQKLSHL